MRKKSPQYIYYCKSCDWAGRKPYVQHGSEYCPKCDGAAVDRYELGKKPVFRADISGSDPDLDVLYYCHNCFWCGDDPKVERDHMDIPYCPECKALVNPFHIKRVIHKTYFCMCCDWTGDQLTHEFRCPRCGTDDITDTRPNVKPKKWNKGWFSIHECWEGQVFEAWTDGSLWNGWGKPHFTEEQGLAFMRVFNDGVKKDSPDGPFAYFDKNAQKFMFPVMDSSDTKVEWEEYPAEELGGTLLYEIGIGWVWWTELCDPQIIFRCVQKGKEQVLDAVAAGKLPEDLPNFSAIHDFFDANMWCDSEWLSEQIPNSEVSVPVLNEIQEQVSKWIEQGGIKSGIESRPYREYQILCEATKLVQDWVLVRALSAAHAQRKAEDLFKSDEIEFKTEYFPSNFKIKEIK